MRSSSEVDFERGTPAGGFEFEPRSSSRWVLSFERGALAVGLELWLRSFKVDAERPNERRGQQRLWAFDILERCYV